MTKPTFTIDYQIKIYSNCFDFINNEYIVKKGNTINISLQINHVN